MKFSELIPPPSALFSLTGRCCLSGGRCCGRLVQRAQFLLDVCHFPLAFTVTFLNLADEAVFVTGDVLDVVVGQQTPFFTHFSFELIPVTANLIPYCFVAISHVYSPHTEDRNGHAG